MVSTIQNYVDLIDKKTEDNKKNAYKLEERFMLAAAIVTFAKDNKKYPKPFEYGTLYGWLKQALFGDVKEAPGLTDPLAIGKYTYWASSKNAADDAWDESAEKKKAEEKYKNDSKTIKVIKEHFKSRYSMNSYVDYAKKVYKRLKRKKIGPMKSDLKKQLNFLWNKITSEKSPIEGHLTKILNKSGLFTLSNGKLSLNVSNVSKNTNKPGF